MTKANTASTLEAECAKLEQAVDTFAEVMKAKLVAKAAQGYFGWNDPKWLPEIKHKLIDHAAKLYLGDVLIAGQGHQAVDVANLAMFLFYLEEK